MGNADLIKLLEQIMPERYIAEAAVSIGCGKGTKLMMLLKKNVI